MVPDMASPPYGWGCSRRIWQVGRTHGAQCYSSKVGAGVWMPHMCECQGAVCVPYMVTYGTHYSSWCLRVPPATKVHALWHRVEL